MGLSPRQVGAMSLWEFGVCVDAWNRAQGGDAPPAMSDDRFDELLGQLPK